MTLLVYEITSRLGRNPAPYLLDVAMSSNVGSVATVAGLLLTAALLLLAYRNEFRDSAFIAVAALPDHVNKPLMWKSIGVALAMIVFFIRQPVPKVAIGGGGFLLITAAFSRLVAYTTHLSLESVPVLSVVTATLSNLVSNVPAVLILESFIVRRADPHRAWFTIAGSVATLSWWSARANITSTSRFGSIFAWARAYDSYDRHGDSIFSSKDEPESRQEGGRE